MLFANVAGKNSSLWQNIDGWLTEEEGNKLQELCKGKTVIEVGAFKGRSTVCIAEVAKLVYSVDTHRSMGNGQTQMDTLTTWDEFRHNTGGLRVIPFCGRLDEWAYLLPKVDVAFIDGDHTASGVKGDIDLLRKKAKLFIFHDYGTFAPVSMFVDFWIDKQGICGSLAWGSLKV